jgi:general stress protein 26
VTNETVLDYTLEKVESIIVCKKHKNREVEYYCSEHDSFMCLKCMIDHLDHKSKIEDFDQERIASYFSVSKQGLAYLQDKINN